MADWKNIIQKKFGCNEKQYKIDDELFVTIKRIDAIKRKQLINTVGQVVTQVIDDKDPTKIEQKTTYTKEWDEFVKDRWKILFEYGVDKQNHSFTDATGKKIILDIAFWEEFAKEAPFAFEQIELEIWQMNTRSYKEEDKKKLNENSEK